MVPVFKIVEGKQSKLLSYDFYEFVLHEENTASSNMTLLIFDAYKYKFLLIIIHKRSLKGDPPKRKRPVYERPKKTKTFINNLSRNFFTKNTEYHNFSDQSFNIISF